MSHVKSYKLSEIADILGAELRGSGDVVVEGIGTLQSANKQQVSFLSNPRYRGQLTETQAAAVILDEQSAADCPVSCLVHETPYLAYARLSNCFERAPSGEPGIHPAAVVDDTATLGNRVRIAANVVVGEYAQIGDDVQLGPNCVIGANARIGTNTRLMANVTLYHDVSLGDNCVIHSGTVVGSDGFGYAPVAELDGGSQWQKIAQLGGVDIGNHVEIGANTTIDRGALDNTIIEDNVIIDNQVQVAHNVLIGRGSAIAGCVGIAGSAKIGRNCSIGGGAGIAGHLSIADGTTVLGMTLINRSIKTAGIYASGTGMQEAGAWRKSAVRFTQLEKLNRRLSALEAQLNDE